MDILERVKEKYPNVVIEGRTIKLSNGLKIKCHSKNKWIYLGIESPTLMCSHTLPENDQDQVFATICAHIDNQKEGKSILELYGLN